MNTQHLIALDPTFGDNGKLEVRPPGNFRNDLSNLTLDASGRLMIYGSYVRETPIQSQPGVARIEDDGAFEEAFGDLQDGFTTAPDNVLATAASSMALMADGSFFITGGASAQLPLVQYDKDGRYIADWEVSTTSSNSSPRLLATHDQKLLIAASDPTGGALYRRLCDGSVDNDFGEEGKTTYLAGMSYVAPLDMARSNTGAFYLAGEVVNDGFIIRFDSNGEPDEAFAAQGLYLVKLGEHRITGCRRVIELATGKIIALINSTGSDQGPGCYLIQLTADGRADPTFNRGEPLRIIEGDVGEDLVELPDGKVLVAHRSVENGNHLTRCLPTGLPDLAFGTEGSLPITFDPALNNLVKSVAVQPDGKIVVGGVSGSGTTLLRFTD